jgi:ATP-binding cassette subfamily C protein LapB
MAPSQMSTPAGVLPDWAFLRKEIGSAFKAFFLPLQGLRDAFAEFRVTSAPASGYLDEPVTAVAEALLPSEGREGNPLIISGTEGRIEFCNVAFRYPSAERRAVSGLNFVINPGEHVAFLGRVGSGKSTIARVILGQCTPEDGTVLINDINIRQYDSARLRASIGAVMQESEFLAGSIRENITFDRVNIDDEEMTRVARISGTHKFVGESAEGYNMRVSDGGEGLSVGQKQSIMIARALAGRPPILVMDAPTSAMDAQSEGALTQHLQEELKGRTLVLFTQRPPLLQLVDRIILIDHGEIVSDGPRENILKQIMRQAA